MYIVTSRPDIVTLAVPTRFIHRDEQYGQDMRPKLNNPEYPDYPCLKQGSGGAVAATIESRLGFKGKAHRSGEFTSPLAASR